MSGYRYKQYLRKKPYSSHSFKNIARWGYYVVVGIAICAVSIHEAIGNIIKVPPTQLAMRSPAAETCQIHSGKQESESFSCAPTLASGGFTDWRPYLNSKTNRSEPSKKGESHDYYQRKLFQ